MPDKSLTVATYAAGASLAAITLIYVFGPTYFLDPQKKGVVGLSNPANDCFINSVLQALAGLGDLRLYLIRETHRRSLDDSWVYAQAVPAGAWDAASGARDGLHGHRNVPEWKVEGLQRGLVTRGLKEILDSLNERPIYKKTISAAPFVRTLEQAFQQRISRQQQDAQEFLQVVAERLCDEYHAGRRARMFARRKTTLADVGTASSNMPGYPPGSAGLVADGGAVARDEDNKPEKEDDGVENGFPLEGKFESQIECLTCGFKPRPTESTFCTLNLNVPRASSTTLNACFDGMFKTEYIDDFKCEKCRLVHALAFFEAEAEKATSESFRTKARTSIAKLQVAIDADPETPPEDVTLPDTRYAPKRRIARHIRLTRFPNIIAIHLSRSIYDASNLSQKNSAKVAFPERLSLGGLLQQRKYKLLGLVTHKGNHHSGHYESFRRQNIYPPFSNPHTFQASGVYSKTASPASTPQVKALQQRSEGSSSPLASTPDLPSLERPGSTSTFRDRDADTNSLRSVAASARSTLSKITSRSSSRAGSSGPATAREDSGSAKAIPIPAKPKKRKSHDRWWRISDEKVKEASTRDVLSMQREVYLLFYELDKEHI
ncbi:hypothetical protein B0H66DRAFT_572393 [Apodospora peruviana]|uniref:Ubiquitin carboxyl-terminal hydrolase n=1 Tax=Apodospora peruviana TaxID=516989 RepID=A0AAE0MFF2_9PEZI|nr:hypothetical protein B0H66DRAFT_572393 [Apodospora peruviana]